MKRVNGKRSFLVHPLPLLAWTPGKYYTPVTETEALLALGWIFRCMTQWKTKANVFDWMRTGSGQGHSGYPAVVLEDDHACAYLRTLLSRLALPAEHPEFVRFAKAKLGFRNLQTPLLVPVRKPAHCVFEWLRNLYGCRLKESPNEFHHGAVWLHGATLRLNKLGTRWRLGVGYSYRHDDGWGISLDQLPGEKLEAFDARAWQWLSDLIQWRHPEDFYHRFMVPADGMKRGELKSCADTERQMYAMKDHLRHVFAWGVGAPGYWERELAEPMVHDAHPQYRQIRQLEMTGRRLRTLKRWLRDDQRERAAKEKPKT